MPAEGVAGFGAATTFGAADGFFAAAGFFAATRLAGLRAADRFADFFAALGRAAAFFPPRFFAVFGAALRSFFTFFADFVPFFADFLAFFFAMALTRN